jgi:hypothetical protein
MFERLNLLTTARVSVLPTAALVRGDSPRLDGEDDGHVRLLSRVLAELPPIVVARSTGQVVDGMHRLSAAELVGSGSIKAVFFDGSPDEAFLFAVQVNVRSGLPLSAADRRAAAERILRLWPQLSDRSVAEITGLAPARVGAIRSRSTAALETTRIGRDGRARPVSGAEGRLAAGRYLAVNPEASLRMIARAGGIALGTARDVRNRRLAGEDVLPPSQRRLRRRVEPPTLREDAVAERIPPGRKAGRIGSWIRTLGADPALRSLEAGRQLLRGLVAQRSVVENPAWLAGVVPAHCVTVLLDVAREYAKGWAAFADQLEERQRSGGDGS